MAAGCFSAFKGAMERCAGWRETSHHYLEPSAGRGDFFCLLPKDRRIGIDLAPPEASSPTSFLGSEGILKRDFLKAPPPRFLSSPAKSRVVVIGNPPFGRRGNTAAAFIQKASRLADTIAFVLPVLFCKYSTQRKVPAALALVYSERLPANSFYLVDGRDYCLNTVFQVWTRLPLRSGSDLRLKTAPPTAHPDFSVWQYNATVAAERVFENQFDFAVLRQGYGGFNHFKYHERECSRRKQWILFKAHTTAARAILKKIDFARLAENNTTAAKGFGKAEVVGEYLRLKEKLKAES